MKGHYNYPLPKGEDGDVFSLTEWKAYVKKGWFLPDDGSGYQATELGYDRTLNAFDPIAEDCTHIVWFNKQRSLIYCSANLDK